MRLRTDWRVEPDDEFIVGPYVFDDDVEQYRGFLGMLNGSLGWEKFRLTEVDPEANQDLNQDQDDEDAA